MAKDEVGAPLARSLGGKDDREYFMARRSELSCDREVGSPSRKGRESPGFLQNASTLVFLNGNPEKDKLTSICVQLVLALRRKPSPVEPELCSASSLSTPAITFEHKPLKPKEKTPTEPVGVLKYPEYFPRAFHFPECGRKGANFKVLSASL